MKWITLQHFAADELRQLWANHGCGHGHTAGVLTSNSSSSRVNQSEDEHRAKKLSLQATVFCRLRLEAEPAVEVVWSWKSRRIAAAAAVVVAVGSVVVQVVSVLLLLVAEVAEAVVFTHTCSSRRELRAAWLSRWLLAMIHHWNRRWFKERCGRPDEIWNLRTANGLTASSLRRCVRPQRDEHLWRSSDYW